MTFSEAINQLRQGKKIARKGWNGKNQYVCLAVMEQCSLATGEILFNPSHEDIGAEFLMFMSVRGYQCGWLASQSDILASDWEVVSC